MDSKIFKIFAGVGGIGGLGLAVFLYLAKDIIPVASQDLLELITLCAFGLAIVCLIIGAMLKRADTSKSKQSIKFKGNNSEITQVISNPLSNHDQEVDASGDNLSVRQEK